MKAEHYKEILLNEYENQELTKEEFKNTLEHFEKLIVEELNQNKNE
jgi:hypothetical protein